jgi:hypothetical protein
MRCARCGAEAPVLKTCCRLRNGGREFALCHPYHAAVAGAFWATAFATTREALGLPRCSATSL